MKNKQFRIWLAGFIDGEGCFNFTRCRKTIYPRILIVNTEISILRKIQKKYGGDITSRKININWKTFNCYRASYKTAKIIIDDVYPYLILKKKQAFLCLKSFKTKDMKKRLQYKELMNKLNKKGT